VEAFSGSVRAPQAVSPSCSDPREKALSKVVKTLCGLFAAPRRMKTPGSALAESESWQPFDWQEDRLKVAFHFGGPDPVVKTDPRSAEAPPFVAPA
jgi:hypothetical protein